MKEAGIGLVFLAALGCGEGPGYQPPPGSEPVVCLDAMPVCDADEGPGVIQSTHQLPHCPSSIECRADGLFTWDMPSCETGEPTCPGGERPVCLAHRQLSGSCGGVENSCFLIEGPDPCPDGTTTTCTEPGQPIPAEYDTASTECRRLPRDETVCMPPHPAAWCGDELLGVTICVPCD